MTLNLTATDIQYLRGRHGQYRAEPARNKAAFREACAKKLLESRNIPVTNEFALEWFKKVTCLGGRVRN